MSLLTVIGVGKSRNFTPPPPPYLIAATAYIQLTTFNINSYTSGGSISAPSPLFKITGDGLIETYDIITVAFSENLEFTNDSGITWFSAGSSDYLFNDSSFFDTGLVYKVRLKTGLPPATYNESITITPPTGSNVGPYIVAVNCTVAVDTNYIQASGGDNTIIDGNYKILEFFNSNNLVITQDSATQTAEFISVGGGAGGGNSFASHGGAGGGGAGGFIHVTGLIVSVGTFPIVIGSGGAAGDGSQPTGYNGSNTTALGYTAIGGGGGGQGDSTSFYNNNGTSGGSGGGAGAYFSTGGAATSGQGSAGGNTIGFAVDGGSGGGGAGGIGAVGSGISGGAGGAGVSSSITGVPAIYAKGGQGGQPAAPLAGAANTGNGGTGSYGGGGEQRAGGSGVFKFRFKFQN